MFDGMVRHDQVSWTSLITGLSQNGCAREAMLMFKEMLGNQIKPNCFTYVSVISACTGLQEAFGECILHPTRKKGAFLDHQNGFKQCVCGYCFDRYVCKMWQH